MTEENFQKLIKDQNSKCAICRIKLEQNATVKHTDATLCIDHCHETGEVRGLLCTKCNKGLGLFNDDVALIEEALNYLRRYINGEKCNRTI